ncbi:MAG: ATP-dependent Clp protease ATP-binding subunit, partial [Sandaracinaceae bacterium]|nr:ATP-dependent Clp protease ATP-binding subunit [Sandaracinaceae bacterium]
VAMRFGGKKTPSPLAIHWLYALCFDDRSAAVQCFRRLGISLPKLKEHIIEALLHSPGKTPLTQRFSARGNQWAESSEGAKALSKRFALEQGRFPLLSRIGRNLTELAALGQLDPLIGRDEELGRIIDILSRRRANNPLLVGPPGVGKSAIVEGLAQAIVAHAQGHFAGPALGMAQGKILLEVSPGALMSGTGLRGALSERFRRLLAELEVAQGRVLLFFDEIHLFFSERSGLEEMGNELRHALSLGKLSCIAATTESEARKSIERDPTLARLFGVVTIDEPDTELAIRIIKGVIPRYEAHHGLSFDPDGIEAAVRWSQRLLGERFLPDKAIAILDRAGSQARRQGKSRVTRQEVAHVVAEEAKIPSERLLQKDSERLLRLESLLAERIVGQSHALSRIADAIRKGAAGFRGTRPIATFLFLGPTGVGKTETAKAIAELLFAKGAMTRIDMSELSESHAVARLVGAPPGYVGHEAGGQLTEAVRRRPYQLLLLDEIEKAHPEVLLALLPLLDEGHLTDARGRTVDFKNTVIVLTSNLGADVISGPKPIGFGAESNTSQSLETRVIEAARKAMPPELWNRIDEVLVFRPLERSDVVEIARRMLCGISKSLWEERKTAFAFDESACEALADLGGFDATLGARPMRRVIARHVESPIACMLLSEELKPGAKLRLSAKGKELNWLVEGVSLKPPQSPAP